MADDVPETKRCVYCGRKGNLLRVVDPTLHLPIYVCHSCLEKVDPRDDEP